MFRAGSSPAQTIYLASNSFLLFTNSLKQRASPEENFHLLIAFIISENLPCEQCLKHCQGILSYYLIYSIKLLMGRKEQEMK